MLKSKEIREDWKLNKEKVILAGNCIPQSDVDRMARKIKPLCPVCKTPLLHFFKEDNPAIAGYLSVKCLACKTTELIDLASMDVKIIINDLSKKAA